MDEMPRLARTVICHFPLSLLRGLGFSEGMVQSLVGHMGNISTYSEASSRVCMHVLACWIFVNLLVNGLGSGG